MRDARRYAQIKAYNAERDRMLLKGDPRALIDFMVAHGQHRPSSVEVAEITLHKTITACRSLPVEYRRKSKAWLIERDYQSWDDGDI